MVIDGLEVRPLVRRLDFYGVDFKDFAVAAEPRRLSAWTARVGAILTYSTKGMPAQVAITWDLFNDRVLERARRRLCRRRSQTLSDFTRYQPTFTWKNPGAAAIARDRPGAGPKTRTKGREPASRRRC